MFYRAKPMGWVKGDKIEPAELNQIDVNQSRAVDGVSGGQYTLADKLSFGGAGGVEFAGTGAAAWPLVSKRILPRVQELRIGNFRLDTGTTSPATAVLRMDASGFPVIRSPMAASPSQAGSWWLVVEPPMNGCAFKDVTIRVAGVAGGSTSTSISTPSFELIAYAPGVGATSLSTAVKDGHTTDGSDWMMPRDTTVTPNVMHVIDRSTFLYFVHVTNPYGSSAVAMDVRRLVARFEVASMEPA